MSDKKFHQIVGVYVVFLLIGTMVISSFVTSENKEIFAEEKTLSESMETQPTTHTTPYNFTGPLIVRAIGHGHVNCSNGSYTLSFFPFGFLFIFKTPLPGGHIFHVRPFYSWTSGRFTGIWLHFMCVNSGPLVFFKGFLLIGSITGMSVSGYS